MGSRSSSVRNDPTSACNLESELQSRLLSRRLWMGKGVHELAYDRTIALRVSLA